MPTDYPGLAPFAKNLKSDLRTAYAEALAEKEAEERIEDHYCEPLIWFSRLWRGD